MIIYLLRSSYYYPPVLEKKIAGHIFETIFVLHFHTTLRSMQHKILLVEDNLPIRENTTEMLELSDYLVLTACNGKDGLDIALQQNPDLILCDIQMPVMDGYLLLEHIRKVPSLTNSRFVFFTASGEKRDIQKGLQMGADDYIVKPFSGDELLGKLKNLLE
jgi:CheY-like chemotaxis protein